MSRKGDCTISRREAICGGLAGAAGLMLARGAVAALGALCRRRAKPDR